MTAATRPSTVAAVLVAGGSGQRLGAGIPKAYVKVGGQTLLQHAIGRFTRHPCVTEVIVVLPRADADGRYATVTPVLGGATRQESVAAGLAAVHADAEFVLVHDVARPFVADSVITAVIEALEAGADAAVPVVPLHDTIRRSEAGVLGETVDRASLVAVQTPQGFRREVLLAAHVRAAGRAATDDAALVEAMGVRVIAVPGSDENFKITTAADLARAQALVLGSEPPTA